MDASDLAHRLPLIKSDTVASAALADEVRRAIVAGLTRTDMAEGGVSLWNVVVRVSREVNGPEPVAATVVAAGQSVAVGGTVGLSAYKRLLQLCRVFAFLAMDNSPWWTAAALKDRTVAKAMYLLDVALRAGRLCADENDSELEKMMITKAIEYQGYLEASLPNSVTGLEEEDAKRGAKFRKFKTYLLILRISSISRVGVPPMAEELYSSTESKNLREHLDIETAEAFAAVLCSMGKTCLSRHDATAAVIWLTRADELLHLHSKDRLAADGFKHLRECVVHSLAMAHLALSTPEGHRQAQGLVQRLEEEVGGEDPRVQLTKLELFAAPNSEVFDATGYADVLRGMVKNFGHSATEFQLLHHHIQSLHNKSPGLGCDVLDEFLLALRYSDCIDWIEKLILTRVWLLVHQREAQDSLNAAERVLTKLRMAISADTAVAAQTLMWKRIEQAYQEKQHILSIQWCRLALCHVFEAGSRPNRAAIERKMLLCFIETDDLDAARSSLAAMSPASRDEPVTQYLLYKLSIKLDDLEVAKECLRAISISTNAKELLYACIIHSRQVRAPRFLVQALKQIADKSHHNSLGLSRTLLLFRCIILELRDAIERAAQREAREDGEPTDKEEKNSAIADLADMIEGAAQVIENSRNNNTAEPYPDLEDAEWFCRVAYSLGLKYAGICDLYTTVRVLSSCIRLFKLLSGSQTVSNVSINSAEKILNCHFLIASSLAALARRPLSTDYAAKQQKDYCLMREHIRAFQVEMKQITQGSNSPTVFSKLSALLIFDFEGAIALGDWDELELICSKATVCNNADTFRVLGNCLLRSQTIVPSKKYPALMRTIIQKLQETSRYSSATVIKYYRCLFQTALYGDNDAAFQVLEEVCQIAQDIEPGKDDWPEDELQFLAATAFNEGIDWFAGNREDRARQWAMSAIKLASQCRDGGKLKAQIGQRFAMLQLGDLEVKESVEMDEDMVVDMDTDVDVSLDIDEDGDDESRNVNATNA